MAGRPHSIEVNRFNGKRYDPMTSIQRNGAQEKVAGESRDKQKWLLRPSSQQVSFVGSDMGLEPDAVECKAPHGVQDVDFGLQEDYWLQVPQHRVPSLSTDSDALP
jgi:hypothetical protein